MISATYTCILSNQADQKLAVAIHQICVLLFIKTTVESPVSAETEAAEQAEVCTSEK